MKRLVVCALIFSLGAAAVFTVERVEEASKRVADRMFPQATQLVDR